MHRVALAAPSLQDLNMIPRPVEALPAPGEFRLDESTAIAATASLGRQPLASVARWLRGALSPPTGLPLPAGAPAPGADPESTPLNSNPPPTPYALLFL